MHPELGNSANAKDARADRMEVDEVCRTGPEQGEVPSGHHKLRAGGYYGPIVATNWWMESTGVHVPPYEVSQI